LLAADRLDPALRIVPMAGQTPQETLWARLQVHPEAHHDLEQAALRSLATFAYATMESLSNLHRAFGTHLERFAAVDAARQAAENRLKASRPKTAD
ncbi:MAG: hypothetical protein O3A51_04975, partial [Verrucomicrobia bacterium]|nr:hypothetical protein [Verrucomicrobiota bacterium]